MAQLRTERMQTKTSLCLYKVLSALFVIYVQFQAGNKLIWEKNNVSPHEKKQFCISMNSSMDFHCTFGLL